MSFNASLKTGASVKTAAQGDDAGGGGAGTVLDVTAGPGISITGTPTTHPIVNNTGVRSLNAETGDLTIQSSGGTIDVKASGTTIDLTLAGSTNPLAVASVKTTSGTGRKTVVLGGDSVMAGNGGAEFSIAYWLLGGAWSTNPLIRQPGGFMQTWAVRGGEKLFNTVNTAVGGTTTANALTNVNAWLISPAPDGSDIICNWGINDVIVAHLPPATSAANVTAILTAVFAARPNSRVHWVSAVWGGGEQWALDANGVPTGANANDPGIRATNAAIKAAVLAFPNARYHDVYTDLYRLSAANNLPAPGIATGFYTADGTHPGQNGANVFSQCLFARMLSSGALNALPTMPPSQTDMVAGDFYDEVRSFLTSGITAAKGPPLLSFNRWEKVRLSQGVQAYPAGLTDAFTEGGGLIYAGSTFQAASPTIYQTPKTNAFALGFDFQAVLNEGGGAGFFGLVDTDNSPGDGLFFGFDTNVSIDFFILREIRAGVKHDTILNGPGAGVGTAFPLDQNKHVAMLFYDGGVGASGAGIWDCYGDFQQIAHLNPSADFPQNPVGLGWGICAGGAKAITGKALYGYNEPFFTPA